MAKITQYSFVFVFTNMNTNTNTNMYLYSYSFAIINSNTYSYSKYSNTCSCIRIRKNPAYQANYELMVKIFFGLWLVMDPAYFKPITYVGQLLQEEACLRCARGILYPPSIHCIGDKKLKDQFVFERRKFPKHIQSKLSLASPLRRGHYSGFDAVTCNRLPDFAIKSCVLKRFAEYQVQSLQYTQCYCKIRQLILHVGVTNLFSNTNFVLPIFNLWSSTPCLYMYAFSLKT
jgi:hypothetical protein